MSLPAISEQKPAWAIWVNSDLTEGRGFEYPLHICAIEATAKRLSHKASTMGCDGTVQVTTLFKIAGAWYGPINLKTATIEDDKMQKRIDARAQAVIKAIQAGLTEKDIEAIRL